MADDSLENRTCIPIVDIMRLLEFCLRTTYFQFRGTLYEQTNGLAMGFPVSPILANIFMEDFELKAPQSSLIPRIWKRYVDDTFAVIHCRYLPRFL